MRRLIFVSVAVVAVLFGIPHLLRAMATPYVSGVEAIGHTNPEQAEVKWGCEITTPLGSLRDDSRRQWLDCSLKRMSPVPIQHGPLVTLRQ